MNCNEEQDLKNYNFTILNEITIYNFERLCKVQCVKLNIFLDLKNSMNWFVSGISILSATTGVILSSFALQNRQPKSEEIGDCLFDLFVTRRIVANSYFKLRKANPFVTNNTFESVGNVQIEEEDSTLEPLRFSGRDHVLVTKRGFALKPSPIQILENTTSLQLTSLLNPISFYSHHLFLKGQLVTEFPISGLKGESGDMGVKGDVGNVGLGGLKGDQGVMGSKGQIGNQGPIGDDGKIGLKGDKGAKGANGLTGVSGLIGNSFDFAKIWPDQASRIADESKVPRPSDFPNAGEYGVVSDDGKVYLSDGLNLTEVDDISQQGMHGEKGLKGEKGSKGEVGEKGFNGLSGLVGEDGLKGFVGVSGMVKGEKGELSGVVGGGGDIGESGSLGPDGFQGQKGNFLLAGFDDISRPIITSIVQGTPPDNFTIEVLNPVYSLPVRVYGWSTSEQPSGQEIVENGDLISVPVDANGQGNALYVNAGQTVWFTWLDNDGDVQEVLGPFTGPDLTFTVTGSEPSTFQLYIDGILQSTVTTVGGQATFPFIGSIGQSYLIQWVENDSFYCEPSFSEGDVHEGTVGGPVNVVYDCYPLETLGGTLISTNTRFVSVSVKTPGGNFVTDSLSINGGPFVFNKRFPRFGTYDVSILTIGEPCTGATGVIPAGGESNLLIGCDFGRLVMNFDQGGKRGFTLFTDGKNRGTYTLFSGQSIPVAIAPGVSWQVVADPADVPNVPSRSGTMSTFDIQVNFSYPPRPYRIQVSTIGVSGGVLNATYELTLNDYTFETEMKTFSGGNGYFDTRASTGNPYSVRFISVVPNDEFQAQCEDKTSSSSNTVLGPLRDPLVGTVGNRDVDIAVRPCGGDSNIPI